MRLRKILCVLFSIAVPLLSIAATPADLQGTWEGKMTREGRERTLSFLFKANASALTGKVFQDGEEFGDMQDVKLSGDIVSFHIESILFSGAFTPGRLEMTIRTPNGNSYKVPCVPAKSAGLQ